jgi:hypothetical protein
MQPARNQRPRKPVVVPALAPMNTMTICSTHGIQMASEPTTKATAKAGPAAPRADAGRRPPGSAGGLAATGGAVPDPDHGNQAKLVCRRSSGGRQARPRFTPTPLKNV